VLTWQAGTLEGGMLEYRALGGLSVVDGAAELSLGGPRQRRLAAVLLIDRNRVLSVDRLAEVVFAGEPTPGAATTLRSYVARLRRVVERAGSGSRVVTRPPGYMLEVGDEAFDVARFEGAVASGRACLTRGDAAGASRVLREGLGRWRGGAYTEFADEDWARPEAQRLGELRLVAYELVADAELACGRAAEIAPELEALAAEHPLREAFQAKLMLALYRSGRQVEALRVYQAHRNALAGELGLEPPPELAELEGRILVHDEALRELERGEHRLRGYRLGERLGTGRDGTVYAARLPGVDRDIAIRVVPEDLANDPGFVRSFDADARRVAALRHPAVVPLYDWWREPGAAYVVMRRLRGGTLRDRLQRGSLPGGEVAALVGRVGAALMAAADAGITHGRVVAESILFDEAGRAYLADFPSGTGDVRVPGDDVRDLAALVAESLSGRRPTGAAIDDVPATVAEALTAALSETEPPPLERLVPTVVAALSGEVAEPVSERPNPYKGLRAFDEPDAEDFFGRDELVDEILARLAGGGPWRRLVLVVGGSGSGKSSLVRAGLLPRVRGGAAGGSDRWFVAAMVPGASPFKELAESLRRVAVAETGDLAGELAASERGIDRVVHRIVPQGGELLLVADQLEELFTLADEGEQRAFLDGLTHALAVADSRLRVVATLRADFYDRPLRFERFGTAVGAATVPIAAMSAAELEAAIVGPAERVGGRVEPALAAELVGAVLHEPAALPSLQFTLYELAARSPDRNLTLAAYRELGGVDAAIAARAEELYRSLDDEAREGVRRLFERLVVVGAEGEATRRPALRSELEHAAGPSAGEMLDVIEVWAQARLLTLDRHPESREPTVEVAHEALLREWPRLRGWLEEDREEIVALGHLREAAASWAELDHDAGALYRGARLDTALQLADRGARALPPRQREFLDASRTERDREGQREADQVARTARANRRLRAQLVALAVALVGALVVGLVAVGQRNRATSERRVATGRELAAAANANVEVDPERSILLALEAVERTRSTDGSVLPEAEEALHRAVTASRIELRVPGIGGRVDWSPDGTVFVTEGPEGSGIVDIRDAHTGESVRSFHGHGDDISDVAFNHDGTLLATTGEDGAARIWDPDTGVELHTVESPDTYDWGVWGPSFSPDGSLFAAAWTGDGVVKILDVGTGRVDQEIRSVPHPGGTSFDPSGTRIAVRSDSGRMAVVIDIESGDEVFTLEGHSGVLTDIAWSPDGRSIAMSSYDGSARLFDARTGAPRFAVQGRGGHVYDLDWNPDATRLITAHGDGAARVWHMTEGGPREEFALSAQDMRNGVSGVAFSPDGTQVMTGDFGTAAARVWDVSVTGDAEIANLPAVANAYGGAVDFTSDGRQLVATSSAGSVTAWDAQRFTRVRTVGAATGSPPARTPGEASGPPPASGEDVYSLDVSPDERLLAAARLDGTVRVWDLATGRDSFPVNPGPTLPGAPYTDVAWSPAGDLLAIAANDGLTGRVTILDRSGRDAIEPLQETYGFAVGSVAFSPDGEQLITTRLPTAQPDPDATQVVIWDWKARKVDQTIATEAWSAVHSPTGHILATASRGQGGNPGGSVDIWDSATGAHIATLAGSTGVVDLAFSSDGSRLATASHDGTVRIWDPSSGEQLLILHGHDATVSSVAFSPDGSRLASVGVDGTVRIWALDPDDLVEIAERGLTRTLTDDECRQYLHTDTCLQT
jgi:WD40 repeat protein/DNA-binding SARP family transcriptional activator